MAYKDTFNFNKALHFAYQAFKQGNSSSEVWGFYFFTFLELTRFIVEPEQEWIKAYYEVINKFNENFPNASPLYREIKALDEDDKPSKELIDELKNVKNSHDEIRRNYENLRVPMSFMTSLLNKGIFETWVHIVNAPDLSVWSTSGELEELRTAYRNSRLSNKVLADIFAVFTLSNLHLLEVFKNKYELIYIQQDQFNELLEEWRKIKMLTEIGAKSIAFNDGKIVMMESSPEEVKFTVDIIEEVIDWIKANCHLVGNPLIDEDETEEKLDFMSKILKSAVGLECSLFIDSFVIFKYSRETFGINCFSNFEFIRAMKEERRIEPKE